MNEAPLEDYDERLYNISLADERSQISTFYTSIPGAATAAVTGSLSSIASVLVLYVIFKSPRGLKTVYNRIIFGLTTSNLLMSIAIAFNTLPMPTDMIYNQFQGIVVGNSYSCTAQGFFMSFGAAWSVTYCASLQVYYMFSIRKKRTDEQIAKCLEPTLHVVSLGYALAYSLSLLAFEAYNPTPLDAWCTAAVYPWWCSDERDQPCLIRAKRESYIVYIALACGSAVILVIMVVSESLVMLEIHSERQIAKTLLTGIKSHGSLQRQTLQEDLARNTRILKQCFVYSIVYLMVLFFPVFNLIHGSSRASNYGISVAHLLIRPLQGFFHMMIFIQHKVHNMREKYPNISFCQAIGKVCQAQEEPEHIISSMHVINADITQEVISEKEEASVADNNRVDSVHLIDVDVEVTSKSAVQDLNIRGKFTTIDLSSAESLSKSPSRDLSGFDLSYDTSSTRK